MSWIPVENDVVWRIVEGEAVVLNVSTGHYYTLNPTATMIWELLVEQQSLNEIIATIVDTTDAKAEAVRSDVLEQVASWRTEGLIRDAERVA
jgi:Coenzyme PQQ synthesis protein D (PqqD)